PLLARTGVITPTGDVQVTPLNVTTIVLIPGYSGRITEKAGDCLSCPAMAPRLNCYSGHGTKGTNVNDDILNAIDLEIAALRQARDILAQSNTLTARKKPATVTHKKPR